MMVWFKFAWQYICVTAKIYVVCESLLFLSSLVYQVAGKALYLFFLFQKLFFLDYLVAQRIYLLPLHFLQTNHEPSEILAFAIDVLQLFCAISFREKKNIISQCLHYIFFKAPGRHSGKGPMGSDALSPKLLPAVPQVHGRRCDCGTGD